MDEQLSTTTVWRIPALRFRPGRMWVIRPWHRSGRGSPQEAAAELHRRRAELIGQLRRRSEARGVPAGAQEEIVDRRDHGGRHVSAGRLKRTPPAGRIL